MSRENEPRIMDQVREVMRLHHYSIHTEKTYCDWIGRYIPKLPMESGHLNQLG